MPIKIKTTRLCESAISVNVRFTSCPPDIIKIFESRFPLYNFILCADEIIEFEFNCKSERSLTINLERLGFFMDHIGDICENFESFTPTDVATNQQMILQLRAIQRKYEGLELEYADLYRLSNEAFETSEETSSLVSLAVETLAEISEKQDMVRGLLLCAKL